MNKHSVEFFEPTVDSAAAFTQDEQDVLDRINRRVASGEQLSDILNFVFEETREIMPCDRIGVSFVEENGKRVVAHWARASYEPLLLAKGYGADLQGSTLEEILESGRIRVIHDLESYLASKSQNQSTKILVKEGVRSSLTGPLLVEGRRVGFLFRSSREANAYSSREVALHLAIAERLSQAVEKAWRI